MKCSKCGKEEALPYRCAYCNLYHCSIHRLPEQHDCQAIELARSPREIAVKEGARGGRRGGLGSAVSGRLISVSRVRMPGPGVEVLHLTVGTLLVLGVGLSFFGFSYRSPVILAALAGAFALSFIIHELAHKYTALRANCWAQFRLHLGGAILTGISILLPFKFIAPGAVLIMGGTTHKSLMRIAAAGPLTNLVLSLGALFILLPLRASFPTAFIGDASFFLHWLGYLNALIAVFNLIPLGPLDGLKVFHGSKRYWLFLFVASIALFVIFALSNP